jgi:hypothetical protein
MASKLCFMNFVLKRAGIDVNIRIISARRGTHDRKAYSYGRPQMYTAYFAIRAYSVPIET